MYCAGHFSHALTWSDEKSVDLYVNLGPGGWFWYGLEPLSQAPGTLSH